MRGLNTDFKNKKEMKPSNGSHLTGQSLQYKSSQIKYIEIEQKQTGIEEYSLTVTSV